MEFSIKEIQRKTKEALLKDEKIKDLYIDLYTKIFISASDGNYAIHCENQNTDELDKIITLFKIDGFTVVTPLSTIITISWR